MIKSEHPRFLSVNIKSLTQKRDHKNYRLVFQNTEIENQCQIQNIFEHNIQYVYRLWPCKLIDRQNIKIQMYQKIKNQNQEQVIVKRGEAKPAIQYSENYEKYQFYGNQKEKSLLILKFRAQEANNIEQQVNNRGSINKNMNQGFSLKNTPYLQFVDQDRMQLLQPSTEISNISIDLNMDKTLSLKKKEYDRYHTLGFSHNYQENKKNHVKNDSQKQVDVQPLEKSMQDYTFIDSTIVRRYYFPSRAKLLSGSQKAMVHKTQRIVASQNDQIKKQKKDNSYFKDISHIEVPNLKSHTIVSKQKNIKSYSLILSNFKVVFNATNPHRLYKLILIFQKHKYQTPAIQRNTKKLVWKHTFNLQKVTDKSFLYYRIVSVDKSNIFEEGQTQILVHDLIKQPQKIFKSDLEVDGSVVGYLEFQFESPKMLTEAKSEKKISTILPKISPKLSNKISIFIEKKGIGLKKKKQKSNIIKIKKDLSPKQSFQIPRYKQVSTLEILRKHRSMTKQQIVNSQKHKYQNNKSQSRINRKRLKCQSKLF